MSLETLYSSPANCVANKLAQAPLLATQTGRVMSKFNSKIASLRKHFFKFTEWDKITQSLLLICVAGILIVTVILPLLQIITKSLSNADGIFVGLANYKTYFESPALWRSAKNSIFIS